MFFLHSDCFFFLGGGVLFENSAKKAFAKSKSVARLLKAETQSSRTAQGGCGNLFKYM